MLALLAWRALRSAAPAGKAASGAGSWHLDIATGVMLAVVNPLAAAFWLNAGGSLLGAGSAAERIATVGAFAGGFVLASLLFTVALAAVVRLGCCFGGQLARVANLLGVAALACFALSSLSRVL